MTNPHGECGPAGGHPKQSLGTFAMRILTTKQAQDKHLERQRWLKICAAWRNNRDREALERHRQILAEHLGNVVYLDGGGQS